MNTLPPVLIGLVFSYLPPTERFDMYSTATTSLDLADTELTKVITRLFEAKRFPFMDFRFSSINFSRKTFSCAVDSSTNQTQQIPFPPLRQQSPRPKGAWVFNPNLPEKILNFLTLGNQEDIHFSAVTAPSPSNLSSVSKLDVQGVEKKCLQCKGLTICSLPLIGNSGNIYLCGKMLSNNRSIYCLNSEYEILWEGGIEASDPFYPGLSTIALDTEERVYMSGPNGIYCLDPLTGKPLGHFPLQHTERLFLDSEGYVYTLCKNWLYCLALTHGQPGKEIEWKIQWQTKLDTVINFLSLLPIFVYKEYTYVFNTFAFDGPYTLQIISNQGEITESLPLENELLYILCFTVNANGQMYFGAAEGKVYCTDLTRKGKDKVALLWSITLDSNKPISALLLHKNSLYATCRNSNDLNALYSITDLDEKTPTSSLVCQLSSEEGRIISLISGVGCIYATTDKNTLFCIPV